MSTRTEAIDVVAEALKSFRIIGRTAVARAVVEALVDQHLIPSEHDELVEALAARDSAPEISLVAQLIEDFGRQAQGAGRVISSHDLARYLHDHGAILTSPFTVDVHEGVSLAQALFRTLYGAGVSFESASLIPRLTAAVHACGYRPGGAAAEVDHDHATRCCREHGTHSSPYRGCMLR